MTSVRVCLKDGRTPFKTPHTSTGTPDLLVELILVQDSIDSDPGFVDVPIHFTWEGISFLKTSLLQVIKIMKSSVSLTRLQVQLLIYHFLALVSSLI